ncbi:hypothetical protein [Limnohabitans sp. DM1]|uniref:hypothetical protein n=1 Tax=Limnohabitans sp. DM1 TaxID=1597955 RepID=UPI000A586D0B|nr:hypothetical protein [Limnohabitans sp. DM1]
MELLHYLYIHALIIFSIPIVLGVVLRKIAGKHAPTHYPELETPEEKRARKRREEVRRRKQLDDVWWW